MALHICITYNVTLTLTCCFNETDALLDEDRDRLLRSDHVGQWHAEVVAFDGFGDGMPRFGPWFLEKKKKRNTKLKLIIFA